MPSIEGHGYSPQCLETTRKRRFEDVDPKVLLARPHESDHWNHVFEFVDKADKAACEQRKEALDRLYQIVGFPCLMSLISWSSQINRLSSFLAAFQLSFSTRIIGSSAIAASSPRHCVRALLPHSSHSLRQ